MPGQAHCVSGAAVRGGVLVSVSTGGVGSEYSGVSYEYAAAIYIFTCVYTYVPHLPASPYLPIYIFTCLINPGSGADLVKLVHTLNR